MTAKKMIKNTKFYAFALGFFALVMPINTSALTYGSGVYGDDNYSQSGTTTPADNTSPNRPTSNTTVTNNLSLIHI